MAVNPGDTVPEESAVVEARALQLRQTPLSLTCMLYKEHLVTDPTADEEALGSALIIPIVTAGEQIVGKGMSYQNLALFIISRTFLYFAFEERVKDW